MDSTQPEHIITFFQKIVSCMYHAHIFLKAVCDFGMSITITRYVLLEIRLEKCRTGECFCGSIYVLDCSFFRMSSGRAVSTSDITIAKTLSKYTTSHIAIFLSIELLVEVSELILASYYCYCVFSSYVARTGVNFHSLPFI